MNRKGRKRNNYNKKQKKLIRCKLLSRPVFDQDTCSKFKSKVGSNDQSNCENCIHSF